MILLQKIREDKTLVIERLKVKGVDAEESINKILDLDDKRRASQFECDQLQNQFNIASKKIGELYKSGQRDEAEGLKQENVANKEKIQAMQQKQKDIVENLDNLLVQLPNIPHESVPHGKCEADNEVVRTWGENKAGEYVPHWDITEKLGLIDFEAGVKITGAGFPVYKGMGARIQRALINFFLAEGAKAGYTEVMPPLMVNETSAYGTGQLPDKEGQMYEATKDGFYIIPTAEVPITNIFRNDIIDEKDLPQKMMGYTPCFRREAGSYGKDVRGLNRLHQFDKVEIVQIENPENSYETLEKMLNHVEFLLQKLDLPYRVLNLCGGDVSFAAAKTIDLEVFAVGQDRWLEVSSVSNFETFQSNRMKIRMRTPDNKKVLAHTLNGSALALPRVLAALLEKNYDGNVFHVPAVLQPFMGVSEIS